MSALWRAVVGVARFAYGFVVGDDLLVAAVMVLGLLATPLLVASRSNPWWLVPPLALVMTAVSLWRHSPHSASQ